MKKYICCSHTNAIGGAELAFCEMLFCLQQQGKLVVTLPKVEGKLSKHLHTIGINDIYSFNWPLWMQLDFTFKRKLTCIYRMLKGLPACIAFLRKEKPNVVIVNTISSPIPLIAARYLGVPVVVFIHENGGFGVYQFLFGERLTKWLIGKLATRVICNSQYIFDTYHAQIPARKMAVVYQSVDITPAVKQTNEVFTIGCVGVLSPQKNYRFLLSAIAKLSDVRLRVAGFCGNEYGQEMMTLCEQLGIQERVDWLGQVADMPSFYASIDMLIACGKNEALGRSVIEAMKCCIPTLVADEGGYKELIHNGEFGFLFTNNDIESLVQGVQTIRNYPTGELTEIIRKAQEYANIAFSYENFCHTLITQLELLCK